MLKISNKSNASDPKPNLTVFGALYPDLQIFGAYPDPGLFA
jgi:hypothetical protein